MSEAPRPLRRNRDFVLLWTGQGTSAVGSQLSLVAYPLLVLELTRSAALAGLVGFARTLPIVLLALPAGVLADRLDRRRLMIATALAGAVALTAVPVALAAGSGRMAWPVIAAVAFLDGAVFVMGYVSERGLVPRLVAPGQLREAVARNEARLFGAQVAGPPLGGLLFGIARAVPFVADACSYLVAALSLSLIRGGRRVRDGEPAPHDVLEGLRWLWRRRLLRFCMLLFAASNPVYTGLYLLVVLIARRHGASASLVGVMLGIAAGGGFAGALLAPRLARRLTPRMAVVGESWMLAAAVPWLLIAHNALLLGGLVAVAELITPVTNSMIVSIRVGLAPDALQGRVQAASTLVSFSAGWAGPLLVGVLVSSAGVSVTVLALAGWTALLAVIATLSGSLGEMAETGESSLSGSRR